ncbi:MAG: S-layer homology domain-containing protein, partial [Butyricicoccus sp.]|nr:S-layer homology domain-containing protein [Butyricicoccus sp.]
MKHLKRLLSVLLTMALLCACVVPAVSAVDDISGHWAEVYLREMNEHGVIKPNGSGSYTPNAVITRAEFMRYINRAFGFTQKADIRKYTDVSPDKWYYESVQIAVKYGYISGTGENKMGPEQAITREQVCAILGRLSKKDYPAASAGSLPFTDASSIASWCLPYVTAMVEDNVLVGSNGQFRPKAYITRGEIARILYAYLGSQLDQNTIYTATDLRTDAPSATVSASCILQDATVAGDLYISEGLSNTSNVTLRNVSVLGTLIISGGAVTLDNVQCESLLVSSPFDSKLLVEAKNGTTIDNTVADSEVTLTTASGATFGNISGSASESAPLSSSVSPDTAAIVRNASGNYEDLIFTLSAPDGTTLQYLLLSNTLLQADVDYTYDRAAGTVQLSAGKIATLGAGEYTLGFGMSAGISPTVTVTVTEAHSGALISPEQMVFSADTANLYHRDI